MTTSLTTPAGTLKRRTAFVTGLLAVLLIATGFVTDYHTFEPVLGFIAYSLAMAAALATALTATTVGVRASAWALALVCWFLAFWGWFGYGWTGSWWDWAEGVVDVLFVVIMALPPVWLLWVSWRMPRPRLDTNIAEAGALLSMAWALITLVIHISAVVSPYTPAGWLSLVFATAATTLVVSAWKLRGRRIAYGAGALACVTMAVGSPVFFPGESAFLLDGAQPSTWVFLGTVAIGVLLQIAWSVRAKVRTVGEA